MKASLRSVLITRPRAAAEAFAERLRQEGIEAHIAPLMEYVPVAADLSHAGEADALVFSSVQAVTMFSEQSDVRALPVFAVGEATALAAANAGFDRIYTSAGDSISLAGLIRARQPTLNLRKLFHPAGEDTAGDLGRLLENDNMTVTRVILYKAEFIETIPSDIEEAIKAGKINTVTLFSARTAQNFANIVRQSRMEGASKNIEAICLSERVARELRGMKWRSLQVTKSPSVNAMVAVLTARDHLGATLQADPVIAAFGGIRPMATRISVPPSTVQGWKDRYTIPDTHIDAIVACAEEDGISLENFWRESQKPANSRGALPQGERRRGGDRRQTPATFDERGYVISPNYVGPDRRSGVDRRERHAQIQQQRIHKEKIRFMWRTILSAAFVSSAIIYLGIFLLMPEYAKMERKAGHVQEMQTEMDKMNQRIIELQRQKGYQPQRESSIEGAINHGIEQAGNMANSAGNVASNMALSGADAVMYMLGNVQQLSGTTQGTAALQSVMQRLKVTLATAHPSREGLNAAVEEARKKDPALNSVIGPVQTQDLGAAAMLLALGELRSNVTNQKSFEDDLLILEKFSENDPAMKQSLRRLAPYARSGVLSRDKLQQEFKAVAADIVMAKLRGEDASVQQRVMARLNGLVKVTKDGETPQGDGTEAVVARAKGLLDKGDVKGAMAELQSLDGEAAQAAQPWMQQAAGTVAADESTTSMAHTLISQLSPAAPADGGGAPMIDVESIKGMLPDFLRNMFGGSSAPYISPSMRGGGASFPMAP